MNKKTKKGFTIVELVIVIAVIAILAAVLIPTFASVIKKANLSNDQQAVANMNKVAVYENILTAFKNPSDVITALYANGWNQGKFSTYSSNHHYAYSMTNNRFYLLDDNDAVIYPESVNKEELWGFYANSRADRIDGVYNYMALENVTQQTYFDEVFSESGKTYTLDLYNHFISTTKPENVTIKLINGVLGTQDESYTTDDSVKTRKPATDLTPDVDGKYNEDYVQVENNKQVFKNLIIEMDSVNYSSTINSINTQGDANVAIDVVFENCSFIVSTSTIQLSAMVPYAKTVVFENCTFDQQSTGNYALTIPGTNSNFGGCKDYRWSVTVNNCLVLSKGRGINLASQAVSADQRFVFTNNTFVIANESENTSNQMALQIAGDYTAYNYTTENKIITFSNNNIQSAFAAIRVHDELKGECVKNIVAFAGNTLAEGIEKVVLKNGDVDTTREAIRDYLNQIFA